MRAASTSATAQAKACSRILGANSSRRSKGSFLESSNPTMRRRGFKITAAATTGPKREPRPASSNPAIRSHPRWRASRSYREEQSRPPIGRGFYHTQKIFLAPQSGGLPRTAGVPPALTTVSPPKGTTRRRTTALVAARLQAGILRPRSPIKATPRRRRFDYLSSPGLLCPTPPSTRASFKRDGKRNQNHRDRKNPQENSFFRLIFLYRSANLRQSHQG